MFADLIFSPLPIIKIKRINVRDDINGCEEFCVPYLDDTAIFSNAWEDHLEHIDFVLGMIN